jgi:Rrf2 family protein
MRLELTRAGDYAVRAMLRLARTPEAVVAAERIASETAIPARFARAILADLQQAGLVTSVTGRSGGYRLASVPDGTSLLDIIEAIEGDSRRKACVLRDAPCGRDGFCDVHAVFFEAQDVLLERLAATSLAELVADPTGGAQGPFGTGLSGPAARPNEH